MVESLKILMLSYWFPPKIAPAPYELARHLVKLGHEVFVFAGTFDRAPSNEELAGVQVIRVKQYFPSFPGHITYGLKASKKLVAFHKRERFDIIHAHGADGWFISKLDLRSKLGIPTVVTMHGSAIGELEALNIESPYFLSYLLEKTHWKAQYYLDKWSLEGADRVIAVSRQTANEIAEDYEVPSKNIVVIFNGVDVGRFSPSRYCSALREKFRQRLTLLYIGRLRIRKGVQYLIKALPLVLENCNDIHLIIVGEGEAKVFLENLARNLGVDESVTFVGRITENDLSAYYASSDVFVCPSLYDPFPLVCLEALASGTPLILTDKVGVKEIVTEDVARVVKARDKKALASAILELTSNNQERKLMGVKGHRLAQEYDWINIAQKTCEVYRDV